MANEKNESVPRYHYYATMLGSAASGMLARIPTHPLDTCKARIQANTSFIGSRSIVPSFPESATSGSTNFANSLKNVSKNEAGFIIKRTGIFRSIAHIARNEGLRGLYRGFGITFVGSAPASCLYFTTYEVSKTWLSSSSPIRRVSSSSSSSSPSSSSFSTVSSHLLAGMLAEAVSCVFWVPIDVIKERMQVQGARSATTTTTVKGFSPVEPATHSTTYYRNSIDAVRQILRGEGIRGIYKGYGASVASFGPFSAIYFATYEDLKQRATAYTYRYRQAEQGHQQGQAPTTAELPLFWQITTASAAGAIASFTTNPLDLVKLRLQIQRNDTTTALSSSSPSSSFRYVSMMDGLRSVVQREGWLALFRGAGARMAFHTPSTAISMILFEQCRAVAQEILSSSGYLQ